MPLAQRLAALAGAREPAEVSVVGTMACPLPKEIVKRLPMVSLIKQTDPGPALPVNLWPRHGAGADSAFWRDCQPTPTGVAARRAQRGAPAAGTPIRSSRDVRIVVGGATRWTHDSLQVIFGLRMDTTSRRQGYGDRNLIVHRRCFTASRAVQGCVCRGSPTGGSAPRPLGIAGFAARVLCRIIPPPASGLQAENGPTACP